MIIDKLSIQNYKSIKESDFFKLEEDLTILLGKNEAGKTSILKSLESFKTDYTYKISDLSLHSNDREEYNSENKEEKDIPMAIIFFKTDDKDRSKLEKIDSKFKDIKILKCTKYFDDHYEIDIPELSLHFVGNMNNQDIKTEITNLVNEINELTELFKDELDSTLLGTPYNTFKEDYLKILDKITSFDYENMNEFVFHNELKDIIEDEDISKHVNEYVEKIESYKNEIKSFEQEESNETLTKILDILPNFMYFSTINELEYEAHWSDLQSGKDKYKTLENLLKLSDLNFNKDDNLEDREITTKVRNGSAKVSGLVNESWTQEDVELDIFVSNKKVVISIYDDKVKKFYNPSVRSQGFQWFLSFYINFSADSEEFENTIILLDDPGVYLHASGQKDLIKTLEKISNSNQIIISTHSPFMVDPNRLERIRIVSNSESDGTKINEKFYKSDFDAFAPIRASIGMTLGDSLFFDRKTLMVEGITDDILIRPMSELLSKNNQPYINTSITAIQSVNSADRAKYFIPFLLTEKIDFVVLLDYDDKGRTISNELIDEFSDDLNVIMYNELKGMGTGDVEIEDLVDFSFYLKAVNNAYKDMFQEKIGKDKLEEEDIDPKTFRGIKNYFRTSDEFSRLDKVLVSKEIARMIGNGENPGETTIKNFVELFEMLNEKLNIT